MTLKKRRMKIMIELDTTKEAILAIGMGLSTFLYIAVKIRHWADVRCLKNEIEERNKIINDLTTMEAVVNFRRKQKGLPPKYVKQ